MPSQKYTPPHKRKDYQRAWPHLPSKNQIRRPKLKNWINLEANVAKNTVSQKRHHISCLATKSMNAKARTPVADLIYEIRFQCIYRAYFPDEYSPRLSVFKRTRKGGLRTSREQKIIDGYRKALYTPGRVNYQAFMEADKLFGEYRYDKWSESKASSSI